MGGSSWNDDFYASRSAIRGSASAFVHTEAVKKGAKALHPKVDPKGVVRESRDSDAHPESNAVAVIFDITGSMLKVPVELQKNLPTLMGLLLRAGYITDPQVMFSCVGDAKYDKAPLQVGQFESGIEMDEQMEQFYLEGGGGTGQEESYELALYFMANKVSMDCFEKRGKKGYLFLILDEPPYKELNKDYVANIIGDGLQANIPTAEVIAQVQEKFELFVIIPANTTHGRQTKLHDLWREYVGQNLILIDNTNDVAEVIASTVGICEGMVNVHEASKNAGKDLSCLTNVGALSLAGIDLV